YILKDDVCTVALSHTDPVEEHGRHKSKNAGDHTHTEHTRKVTLKHTNIMWLISKIFIQTSHINTHTHTHTHTHTPLSLRAHTHSSLLHTHSSPFCSFLSLSFLLLQCVLLYLSLLSIVSLASSIPPPFFVHFIPSSVPSLPLSLSLFLSISLRASSAGLPQSPPSVGL